MMNVHSAGGGAMMEAARKALNETGSSALLIGVTVLTSLDQAALASVGVEATVDSQVERLARLSADSGLDGVVCSPREIGLLRRSHGADFSLVTPGIRPANAAAGDQKRVMTPSEAVAEGASYLVIGRPITAAADPLAALSAIEAELGL